MKLLIKPRRSKEANNAGKERQGSIRTVKVRVTDSLVTRIVLLLGPLTTVRSKIWIYCFNLSLHYSLLLTSYVVVPVRDDGYLLYRFSL